MSMYPQPKNICSAGRGLHFFVFMTAATMSFALGISYYQSMMVTNPYICTYIRFGCTFLSQNQWHGKQQYVHKKRINHGYDKKSLDVFIVMTGSASASQPILS